jgi:hypothetical protein
VAKADNGLSSVYTIFFQISYRGTYKGVPSQNFKKSLIEIEKRDKVIRYDGRYIFINHSGESVRFLTGSEVKLFKMSGSGFMYKFLIKGIVSRDFVVCFWCQSTDLTFLHIRSGFFSF